MKTMRVEGATMFNQPLETWNVSNVELMEFLFFNAAAFDQQRVFWNGILKEDVRFDDSFVGTLCPSPNDPDLANSSQALAMCHVCNSLF